MKLCKSYVEARLACSNICVFRAHSSLLASPKLACQNYRADKMRCSQCRTTDGVYLRTVYSEFLCRQTLIMQVCWFVSRESTHRISARCTFFPSFSLQQYCRLTLIASIILIRAYSNTYSCRFFTILHANKLQQLAAHT